MRLRNVKNAMEIVNSSDYTIKNETEYKGNFKSIFKNDNPIKIEIGMGKGDFIIKNALKYPDVNFIGIERYESVMVRAIQKLDEMEHLDNLKLIRMDAANIDKVFYHEVDTVYLNFSDPWPKKRHARRRLTSPDFLGKYESIFTGNPHIVQKTDNIGLFAYSITSLSTYGYTIDEASLDLANEEIDNLTTEYEERFMSRGVKINYLNAVKYLKK